YVVASPPREMPATASRPATARGAGGEAPPAAKPQRTTKAADARALCEHQPPIAFVEVAGIEPASFGTSPGLLRAEPALAFLSPGVHAGKSPTGSVTVWCPA